MKITRLFVICATLLTLGVGSVLGQDKAKQSKMPSGPGLTLTSTAFADGSTIPGKFTQDVPNPVSPKLEWTHVPAGTASFVLILHDPDVAIQRTTEDVLHWMVFNIPGSARDLPEGVPANAQMSHGAIQAKNRRGTVGYMGPGAPAAGPDHHYTFELFALDTKLDLGADATRADVLKAIDGHIVGKGVLVGRFHK
jgi:Raf kinase inhibitor-like YbhB/YbcL family protein